ncbi:MAG: DUF362 domain-containing protein [Desulfarculales bacterium]|jgi:uncharacterized protein (DUF362 family)|nr:DUF362 domain-containing protein [Desulfarculales bacterium]
MNRRAFLKIPVGGLLVTAGFSLPSVLTPALASAAAPPDVAVVKGSPAAAAREAIRLLGGMERFVRPGDRVVIKPNMSFAHPPENATNTNPEVVREVLVMCKEARAGRVLVLDNALQNPELSLSRSGIRDACDSVEKDICKHLQDIRYYKEAGIPDGKTMTSNSFMSDVLEADVLIAVPICKSHNGAGVSLSLKGQMGLIYDRHIMHRGYLSTAIVDLCTRIKPDLAIIDASRVLTNNGPGGPGRIITPGEVIASADPVSADAVAVASYEWSGQKLAPRNVGYIREAHERGLGRMDIEALDVRRVML